MQKAEINELLTKAKDLLKSEVTGIAFQTWIKDIEIQSIENNTITVLTGTKIQREKNMSKKL